MRNRNSHSAIYMAIVQYNKDMCMDFQSTENRWQSLSAVSWKSEDSRMTRQFLGGVEGEHENYWANVWTYEMYWCVHDKIFNETEAGLSSWCVTCIVSQSPELWRASYLVCCHCLESLTTVPPENCHSLTAPSLQKSSSLSPICLPGTWNCTTLWTSP